MSEAEGTGAETLPNKNAKISEDKYLLMIGGTGKGESNCGVGGGSC